jgi:hypothetical protein
MKGGTYEIIQEAARKSWKILAKLKLKLCEEGCTRGHRHVIMSRSCSICELGWGGLS